MDVRGDEGADVSAPDGVGEGEQALGQQVRWGPVLVGSLCGVDEDAAAAAAAAAAAVVGPVDAASVEENGALGTLPHGKRRVPNLEIGGRAVVERGAGWRRQGGQATKTA